MHSYLVALIAFKSPIKKSFSWKSDRCGIKVQSAIISLKFLGPISMQNYFGTMIYGHSIVHITHISTESRTVSSDDSRVEIT